MFGAYDKNHNFSELLTDVTKNGYKFDSSYYCNNGEIAIVDQGKELICGYKDKEPGKEPYKKECIVFGDHTEIFKYINFPIYLGADGTKLLDVASEWNTRFVYEFLNIYYDKVGGYSRHFKFLKETMFSKPPKDRQIEFEKYCKLIDKLKFVCHSKYFL